MIISASYRTDIPAYYADWFKQRLHAAYVDVKNPYNNKISRIDLSPEAVDGYVFWTRNPGPFIENFRSLRAARRPFVVQFTLTGYGKDLEAATLPTLRGIELMKQLRQEFGPDTVVWRYDPIVLTSRQDREWHVTNFAYLAEKLQGISNEVTLSFMEPYAKIRRRMDLASRQGDFELVSLCDQDKNGLAMELQSIATAFGFQLTACTQPNLSIPAAKCIDAARLSVLANRDIHPKTKGNRPGCLCAQSRDIGSYDSCAQGCAYCYAVRSFDGAKKFIRHHDPDRDTLDGK